MAEQVKIKVRANEQVRFPGLCVRCAQPASGWMGLRKRVGRVTRMIDVPLCGVCQRQLGTPSGEEERLRKLGGLAALALFLATWAVALPFTPGAIDLIWRVIIALLPALLFAGLLLLYVSHIVQKAASPEKRSVRDAAGIVSFSWRATTFEFDNETFAESFRTLNEAFLMDV